MVMAWYAPAGMYLLAGWLYAYVIQEGSMPLIKRFEDILAWQEARLLTRQIYRLSAVDPFARDFALRDQIRRAAVSAMTNIAEGFDCDSRREFARFLGIARRSAVEVQSLLYVAFDVQYISEDVFMLYYAQAAKTKGLIGALKHSLSDRT
jgi:four helix bundle protein